MYLNFSSLGQYFIRYITAASVPACLCIILTNEYSLAQSVNSAVGASSNFSPVFGIPATYSPAVGVNCPSPTLNVTAFGGNANNWSSENSTGLGNYGGALTFSLPIGNDLDGFCESYAAKVLRIQEMAENDRLYNSEVQFLNNCISLKDNGVNFNDEVFSETGKFASFSRCKALTPNAYTRQSPTPPSEQAQPVQIPQTTPVFPAIQVGPR